MEFLFDSDGQNIGFYFNGHLWALDGSHIARFLITQGIFINQAGNYIGEMYLGRVVYNERSPHRGTAFGQQGDFGKMGRMNPMLKQWAIQLPHGYAKFNR